MIPRGPSYRWTSVGAFMGVFVCLLVLLGHRRDEASPGWFSGGEAVGPELDSPGTPLTEQNFFGLDRIHRFEITLAGPEWDVLQTSTGRGTRGLSALDDDYTDDEGRLIHRSG